MANDLHQIKARVEAAHQRYLAEACLAKVSVRTGRSWQLVGYKSFGDMGDALAWAEKLEAKAKKTYNEVKSQVVNRTERQWKNALLKSLPGVTPLE